jgi:hypothetical protein
MNLPKILSLLPKHPRKAYLDAIGRKPREYGMYVACDIFDGNEKTYRLIFLDNFEQLIDFIPSLLLSNLSVLDIGINNNSVDYKEIYDMYSKFTKLKNLSVEVIAELEKDFGYINVLNVGFISTFFDVSLATVDYIKNNPKIIDYDELAPLGLNMSEYYILSGFSKKFDAMPSELPAEFLDYLASLNTQ